MVLFVLSLPESTLKPFFSLDVLAVFPKRSFDKDIKPNVDRAALKKLFLFILLFVVCHQINLQ